MYDKNDIYVEDNFKIYFHNTNSIELKKILLNTNIRVLSYIIEGNKYYARNIDELYDIYTKDKSLKDKIYYDNYGIDIDGINVVCQVSELIKLEKIIHFY